MTTSLPRVGRVVIVDDDADIRDMLSDILELVGCDVMAAADGVAALALLRDGRPTCLVLLDLMMPNMNGWQFRAAQQGDAALADIPVVLLSGGGDLKRHEADLAAVDSIEKPVDLDRLLALVHRYCV
jgi:two-component system response regulator MprA